MQILSVHPVSQLSKELNTRLKEIGVTGASIDFNSLDHPYVELSGFIGGERKTLLVTVTNTDDLSSEDFINHVIANFH